MVELEKYFLFERWVSSFVVYPSKTMLDLKNCLLYEGISLQLWIICAFLFMKMAELEKFCFWKVGFFLGHILNGNIIVWKLDLITKYYSFKKCLLSRSAF